MGLTDVKVKQAKPRDKQYKMFDGEGLYLLVHSNGGKYWQLKYRFNGEKVYSIGRYPAVTLAQARKAKEKVQQLLANGEDPSFVKRQEKQLAKLSSATSFESIAREWLEWRRSDLSERYWNTLVFRLETFIFPTLGRIPMQKVKAADMLYVLRAVEKDGKLDLLRKLNQNCSAIFRFAVVQGKAERDVTTDLKGAFKSKRVENRARLSESELPEFLCRLGTYKGEEQTRIALEIVVRTFVRTIELRGSMWNEIDFDRREWIIPAERMKMGRKHLVPLSDQVLQLFKNQRALTGDTKYVFPIEVGKNPYISENRMLYALYNMEYRGRATVHGFRGTASTILNEHEFNRDWIEMQLAHWDASSVRGAYNHAQYLVQRGEMMQWYSDHLDSLKAKGLAQSESDQ